MIDPTSPQHWIAAADELRRCSPGAETDDRIDELLESLQRQRPRVASTVERQVTTALLSALVVAASESTRRDVAFALARLAPAGDTAVADSLAATYRAARSDPSLGPELLHALAVLAVRDSTALPDLFAALARVTADDTRYLVIRAAKIIGRLEGSGIATHAKQKLASWTDAPDLAMQAEARQQLALLSLRDALTEPDAERLRAALQDCRAAFLRADLSEEFRQDARRFVALIELLLAYLPGGARGGEDSHAIRKQALALKALIDDPACQTWAGYASDLEAIVEYRLYRIATGSLRLANEMDAMPIWTNFDASLVELAAIWHVMWSHSTEDATISAGDHTSVTRIEDAVILPRVGALLERAVGRQRIYKVLETIEHTRGASDPTAATIRVFYEAVCRAERERTRDTVFAVDTGAFKRLVALAPAVAAELISLIPDAEAAVREAGLDVTPAGATLRAYRVPTDAPECYGNDPSVDAAVRGVLHAAWDNLGSTFPRARWMRFREMLVFFVKLARNLRNDLPDFVRSAEDGGKGQAAGEIDLQQYVFAALRQEYGRAAAWEESKIAGGRVDIIVHFDEGDFPVEVKAEYSDVSQEHVRSAYLPQVDRYASERDRVAFLLVLDLRATNAIGHRRRRGIEGKQPHSLYSLAAGFWVDGLPVDPQVAGAASNVVVVGLYLGNQRRPSSMTAYSRRPGRPP